MKHTKEVIITALKVIKDECEETECGDCPFGHKSNPISRCRLKISNPALWEIAEIPPEKTWRALK